MTELETELAQERHRHQVTEEAANINLDRLTTTNMRLGDVVSQLSEGFRAILQEFDRAQGRNIHKAKNGFIVSYFCFPF